MIYLIYGKDIEMARKKAFGLALKLREKKPDALFDKIDEENWSVAKIEEYLSGSGLFVQKCIVYIDRVFQNGTKEMSEYILEVVPQMQKSENIFIVGEGNLSKKEIEVFTKHAEKVEEHEEKKAESKRFEENLFTIGDHFGERDKAKLWMLYVDFIKKGISAEEIHGILWWQLKSIYLASVTKSALESGLSPFVYNKSKKYATNYKKEELEKMMDELVVLPTKSRIDGKGLGVGLERWILGL